MINVLIFGLNENPGGVESFLYNYVTNIDKTRVHFDFLCNSDREVAYEKELKAYGCRFYHVTPRNINPAIFYRKLHAFFAMKADRYDAIWVNINSLANIDYLKYAKKFGIKRRIVHSHNAMNMDSNFKGQLRGVLHHKNKIGIEHYATDFFACSKQAAKWFYKPSLIDQVRVIPNAIDISKMRYDKKAAREIRTEFGLKDELLIGNIGRLHFQKNQSFALDIFKKVLDERSDARLMLVGDGEDREMLVQKAKDLGIEDKVIFTGVRRDIPKILSALDLFLFPSLFEGLPIAALEAQAAGLPIVASKDTIPDELKVNSNFEFVSLDEPAAIWAEDVVWLSDVGKEAWDNIQENFAHAGYDIKVQARKLTRYFESMEG